MSVRGNGVLSTLNTGTTTPGNDTYAYYLKGTSMATPHVAGVAALMLSVNSSLTPAQVRNDLAQYHSRISGNVHSMRNRHRECPGSSSGRAGRLA